MTDLSLGARLAPYKLRHKVRFVTAAALFDGHDASINIMRRILQASGAEVIHLGHDRSVAEIVDCAIQEDAQAIALTSYQGGHVEYLKYMHDLLEERGAGDILIFGGGGGTILPSEMEELHAYGITRLYSPDDGRALGLQGMIDDLLKRADHPTVTPPMTGEVAKLTTKTPRLLGKLITLAETHPECREALEAEVFHTELGKLKVTLSVGVATYPKDASDSPSLFEAADKALYAAKHGGRNQVCSASR